MDVSELPMSLPQLGNVVGARPGDSGRAALAAGQSVANAQQGALLVLLAGTLFGTTGTARAISGLNATPVAAGAFRILVGGLALAAVMPRLGVARSAIVTSWRRRTVLLMAAALALFQISFFVAVSSIGVARGTLVAVGTAPVLAGFAACLVLGDRPSRRWGIATAIAITGLVLRSGEAGERGGATGVLMALVAALCITLYNISVRVDLSRGGSPVEITASSSLLAGLLLVPLLVMQPLAWVATPAGLALILYVGVVTAAAANFSHALGLRRLAPGPATTLQLAGPVVATLLGVLVLGEAITPIAGLGVVLAKAGLALQAAGTAG